MKKITDLVKYLVGLLVLFFLWYENKELALPILGEPYHLCLGKPPTGAEKCFSKKLFLHCQEKETTAYINNYISIIKLSKGKVNNAVFYMYTNFAFCSVYGQSGFYMSYH